MKVQSQYKGSKFELRSVKVERHFGAEDYLFSRTADNEREHFLTLRFKLDF
jgi:hypothetical protein